MGGGYFQFNREKKNNLSEKDKKEFLDVSDAKENDFKRSNENFAIAGLRDYDTIERTLHYFQIKFLNITIIIEGSTL